ncbi:MAG: extensin family protein [Pseudomonadota bacterium]
MIRFNLLLACVLAAALVGCVSKKQQSENIRQGIISLTEEECLSILRSHDVQFEQLNDIEDVQTAIRVNSPLGGVIVEYQWNSETHSIMDCRLAVALLAWAPTLRRFGITRLRHLRVYSPGVLITKSGRTSSHAWALAIDAAYFERENAPNLKVERDWTDSEKGVAPCPPREWESANLHILRTLVCEAAENGLFQIILTPHYNAAHYNHLHLEVSPKRPFVR